MKNLMKNLFKKEPKRSLNDLSGGTVETLIREGEKTSSNSFIGDFQGLAGPTGAPSPEGWQLTDYITEKKRRGPEPMKMTSSNIAILKDSIVIATEFPVNRKDLQFIGNSRIDSRPIYRYVGNDFSTFDIPYEEIISL